jgi:hypothetical protein
VDGINNAGVVAGYFFDSHGGLHAFIRTGIRYKTIDVPGAELTAVQGIND